MKITLKQRLIIAAITGLCVAAVMQDAKASTDNHRSGTVVATEEGAKVLPRMKMADWPATEVRGVFTCTAKLLGPKGKDGKRPIVEEVVDGFSLEVNGAMVQIWPAHRKADVLKDLFVVQQSATKVTGFWQDYGRRVVAMQSPEHRAAFVYDNETNGDFIVFHNCTAKSDFGGLK